MRLGDLLFGVKVDQGKLKVETAKIKAQFNEVGGNIEKNLGTKTIGGMEKKLGELNKELKLVSVGSKEFKKLQKEINKTEKELSKANGKASLFSKAIKGVSGALAAVGVLNVAKNIVVLGANLEQAQISFEVMLGSAEKAKFLLQELTDFAESTPFELVGLRQDAKLLLAMGIQMEDLIPTMTFLGNAASGLSIDFNRLALAYGQVQAKGKLQGGELKQFTEAGVPLIKVLGEELGVTSAQFYDMVEAGEISAAAVTRAFEIMSEENGIFHDLMGRQSETLGGVWSNLQDSAASLGEGIGIELIPFMKGLVHVLHTLLEIVPIVSKAFVFGFTLISSAILDAVYGGQLVLNNFIVFFQKSSNNISGVASDIGRAFSMIPNAIKNSLNKGLETIEKFLNSAIDGVNNFAKKFGIDEAIGNISLGRANVDFTAGQEGFTSIGRDFAAEKNAVLSADQDIYKERKNLARQFNMKRLMDSSDALAAEIDLYKSGAKKAQKFTGGSILGDLLTPEYLPASGDGGSSDAEKNVENVLEKEEERLKRREKFLEEQEKKRNTRLKKQLDFVTDTVTDITDVIDDEISTSEKNIDKYIDQIEKLGDTIKSLDEESEDIKDDLFDYGSIRDQKKLERLTRRYKHSLETLGNDTKIDGEITIGDLRDFNKIKDRQAEIEAEKELAKTAIQELTLKKEQEQLILEDYQEKRKTIDSNYLEYRSGIESKITDSVFIEAQKQESIQDGLIKKWKQVANERREAMNQSTNIQESGVPGFYNGGYTGDGNPKEKAGDVHKQEFVVNNRTLRKNPGLLAELQKIQSGGPVNNSRNATVEHMVVNNQIDVLTGLEKLAFRL